MTPNPDGTAVFQAATTKPLVPTAAGEGYDGRRGEVARLQEHFERNPFPSRGLVALKRTRQGALERLPRATTGHSPAADEAAPAHGGGAKTA